MREIFLRRGESTGTSLVFGDDAASGEGEFFITIDEKTRAAISDVLGIEVAPAPVAQPAPEEPTNPDPGMSAPMTMRPREIQERIRSGASIPQLAHESGVAESRIEPFAHPVLLERSRVAQQARQAHPVREDGPARLTLWEVLATAFAARGQDLSRSTWDAYRDVGGQWVVSVTWNDAEHGESTAEWTLNDHLTSQATAVPRNPVAAELVDPDFASPKPQPRPNLTAVGKLDDERPTAPVEAVDDDVETTRDDLPIIDDEQEAEGDDFLQHPGEDDRPAQRRRKAVTPHWEDVLLGVRTNTKRPRK